MLKALAILSVKTAKNLLNEKAYKHTENQKKNFFSQGDQQAHHLQGCQRKNLQGVGLSDRLTAD